MKGHVLKTGAGGTIFIFLIFAAFAAIRPSFVRLSEWSRNYVVKTFAGLEKTTGLKFSYASLSPSILSAIRIKGIVVSDPENKNKLLSVKKAVLSYDIRKLLTGRYEQALTGLVINGLTLEYNAVTDAKAIERLRALFAGKSNVRDPLFTGGAYDSGVSEPSGATPNPAGARKTADATNSADTLNPAARKTASEVISEILNLPYEKFTAFLPASVRVRNISLHYAGAGIDILCRLKKLQFSRPKGSAPLTLDAEGFSDAKIPGRQSLSFGFAAHAVFPADLKNITTNLYLSNISNKDFRINSINLLCEYAGDEKIYIKTLRNAFPFTAEAAADMKKKEITFSFSCKNLMPFQLVYFSGRAKELRKLLGLSADLDLSGSYLIDTKKISYASGGKLNFPHQFISGGLTASYSVSGDNEGFSIPFLDLNGRDYDVSYSGEYSVKNSNLSGSAQIRKIRLSNGGIISSELYFDPLPKGFMVFAPQLFLGEKAFTALQLSIIPREDDSLDFNFEASDYSHTEAEEPGILRFDGSYLPGNRYVQTSLTAQNLYMDSIVNAVAFVLPSQKSETLKNYAGAAAPYIFSGETYLSYDFETFSFNVPYSIIANTQKDRQLLIFSLNGNNDSLQISRFDVLYGERTFNMTALAEFSGSADEAFFSSDMMYNGIPYRVNGTASSSWIDITGDYGFQSIISLNRTPSNIFEPYLSGTLHFENLPFSTKKYVFTSSCDSSFSVSDAEGFSAVISRFEMQEPSGRLKSSPKLSMNGNISRYGFIMELFAISDASSILSGNGSVLWNVNNGILDSLTLKLDADSALTGENWNFSADITNPLRRSFSFETLKKDCFFSAQFDVKNFPAYRLFENQGQTDTVSFLLSGSGTLENPYLQLDIGTSSVSLLGSPVLFNGKAVLEDKNFTLSGADINWIMLHFGNMNMQYSLESGSGSINTDFEAKVVEKSITTALEMKIDNISPAGKSLSFTGSDSPGSVSPAGGIPAADVASSAAGSSSAAGVSSTGPGSASSERGNSAVPKSYILTVSAEKVEGTIFTSPFAAGLSVLRTPGRYDVYSSGDIKISGYVLDDGSVNFETGEGFPIRSFISGYVHSDGMSIAIDKIYADLKDFAPLLTYPFIAVHNGIVEGYCRMEGLASDPAFSGSLTITDPEINLPIIIPEHLYGEKMFLTIENSEMTMPDTLFKIRGNTVTTSLDLSFDRWNFDGLSIDVRTAPDVFVPADLNLGDIRITGKGSPDLHISVSKTQTDVTGSIYAKETSVNIAAKALASAAQSIATGGNIAFSQELMLNYTLTVSLDIMMGQSVQVLIDPLVRGVAAPGTPLHFTFDSSENRIALDSDISFRGGELIYLNRNFYMREGRIVFTDRQELFMDPVITIRAETRERDDDGNQVTITLSANNQLLSMFSPRFSATPAKSEKEIMELLGQIITADSSDAASLLVATGDYALQVTVMRKIESALRDLLNFDIFSIRTMILQNAMKQGLNLNIDNGRVTAGNFFDNSTVYMGKYFGRELYADALLHWTYDEDRIDDNNTVGGLVFQPEFGLEMSSPFVNIRWGIAPDIDAIKENRWIPTTSVSLSWKFNF
ncbi:hypothetical protein HRI96_07750 [Treponema parvum]|uniref:Uncharacterized protein n=1 Tax=Treponema parvum TaxID=138851 RepID=A0A975F0A1_9SPIR|nr:hypothetical protein [Treponema parvum]QTQ12096.1 hypothetical protein HRI96_07750 [Treponema parvum]